MVKLQFYSLTTNFVIILIVLFTCLDGYQSAKHSLPKPASFEKCYDSENELPVGQIAESAADYSRTLITGLHRFSVDILRSLHNFESKDSSNGLILSPFSIWSALLVSYMGARGDTSKELRGVLGLSTMPKHAVGMAYQGLKFWYQLKKNVSVSTKDASKKLAYSMANRIFINDNLKLNDCIKQHFGKEAQTMDFTRDPSKARKKINSWIESETHGKIKDLIPAGGITQWTTIVIANALYFHSKWLHQFDPAKTETGTFHVSPVESIQVPYMKITANLMYGISETLGATILELPYSNQDFSMLILLPDSTKGIDSLVRQLKPSHLDEILQNMFDDEISVVLPKFRCEQEFELAGPLYSMGVKKLFDPRFADLSGFVADIDSASEDNSTETSHSKGVTVNSVVHKVFVSVDEEGTEAAASTAILIARSGRPAFPTRFVVDRPFLFIIRDTATNIILFIGIVRRPMK